MIKQKLFGNEIFGFRYKVKRLNTKTTNGSRNRRIIKNGKFSKQQLLLKSETTCFSTLVGIAGLMGEVIEFSKTFGC